MDSKTLFIKQVAAHAATLTEILGCHTGGPAPGDVIDRSVLGTHMLAGTASLMGLERWSEACSAYERLLARFRDGGYAWDERIAEVTAALIEKEELVVDAVARDATMDLDSIVSSEELDALVSEMSVVEEEGGTSARVEYEDARGSAGTEVDRTVTPGPVPDAFESSPAAGASLNEAPEGGPLPGVLTELRASFVRLSGLVSSSDWSGRVWASQSMREIRRELTTIDFYAQCLEKVIGDHTSESSNPRSTLTPLRIAMADFTHELGLRGSRRVEVRLAGEECPIDPRLLPSADLILQCMVTDIAQRVDRGAVTIHVAVEERNGALHWTVTDDGNNFVADSPIDGEDHLAFYPGLRTVIKVLGRHRGVLWVEPRRGGNEPAARFAFTLPVTEEPEVILTWGEGNDGFAARASQVCDFLPADSPHVHNDEYGDWVDVGEGRVPLVRLDDLFGEAPSRGDAIAVVGSVEKRIAFFVPDRGRCVEAHVYRDSVPPWRGGSPHVAQVDERRLPVIDADHVVEGYLKLTGALDAEGTSGGVGEEARELSPRQAGTDVGRVSGAAPTTPPVSPAEPENELGGQVLVVEQSETMRDTLADILSGIHLAAAAVRDVNEAIDLVRHRPPRLIISEFRMPTMAAKRLVDVLREDGRDIPVLVTTSQSGKTAELLVEKLGASGYLSKPLDPTEVSSRVAALLRMGVPS